MIDRGFGMCKIVVGHLIYPFLKKWWGTMLSNHQKVVGHVPLGPTYSNTPDRVCSQLLSFISNALFCIHLRFLPISKRVQPPQKFHQYFFVKHDITKLKNFGDLHAFVLV